MFGRLLLTTTTMKQLIICQDVGGYTERLRALQDAHEHVVGITPHDKPCEGFTPVKVPKKWMTSDPRLTYPRKCWQATGTLGLAAIHQLKLDADAFWFIESDCVASVERWRMLMEDHAENPDDGSFVCPSTRKESLWNPWWTHAGTPAWADAIHINAIYRLSRRAAALCIASAVEFRECFGEVAIGSQLKRAGMTLGRINRDNDKPHHNNQTIKAQPGKVLFNPRLINHPVKANTYGPPLLTNLPK